MRVLAVDPGYDRLGVAVVTYESGIEHVVFSSCIETDKTRELRERLLQIGTEFEQLLTTYQPDTVAVETLFFNKNVKTAIGVAQARGVILYIAQKYNCMVHEFGPQEIKVAVTGYGGSDKTAVMQMLQHTVQNLPANALDDEYDAIAVGVTCLAHFGRAR